MLPEAEWELGSLVFNVLWIYYLIFRWTTYTLSELILQTVKQK